MSLRRPRPLARLQAAETPVSPELVLVDPVLRNRLIAEERLKLGLESLDRPAIGAAHDLKAGVARLIGHLPRFQGGRTQLTLAGLCGSALTVIFLVGIGLPSSGSDPSAARRVHLNTQAKAPAAASSIAPAGATATTPHVAAKAAAPPALGSLAPRFAWAPVNGATAYDVAIYSGSVPVFRTRTHTASVVIPTRRPGAATARGLKPGTYKWYVWPVRQGKRSQAAIVSSQLVVPAA